MDRKKFLAGVEFCSTHPTCGGCPLHENCKGAHNMLTWALQYIKELIKENEKLRNEQNKS